MDPSTPLGPEPLSSPHASVAPTSRAPSTCMLLIFKAPRLFWGWSEVVATPRIKVSSLSRRSQCARDQRPYRNDEGMETAVENSTIPRVVELASQQCSNSPSVTFAGLYPRAVSQNND